MISKKNIVITVSFVFASMFCLSPVFIGFVGIAPNLLSLICSFTILILNLNVLMRLKFSSVSVLFSIVLLSFALIYSAYWGVLKLAFFQVYLVISFFVVLSLSKEQKKLLVEICSQLMLYIGFFAVVGFIYALIGGNPLFELENADGRSSFFYLTTMTNSVVGNFIRPSGIFDEPGALSFMICLFVAMRERLGMPQTTSLAMLLLGMFTLSVAHIIFFLVYVIYLKKSMNFWVSFIIIILIVFVIGISFPIVSKIFDQYLFARFIIVDGGMAGDNRSALFMNAVSLINSNSFFWGVDSSCILEIEKCNALYPRFGENPLSPLVLNGIGISLPYYLTLLYLVFHVISRKRSLYVLGVFFLLLQRPNIFSYGYSLVICLFVVLLINPKKVSK